MDANNILLIATLSILFAMTLYFNHQFNKIGQNDEVSKRSVL